MRTKRNTSRAPVHTDSLTDSLALLAPGAGSGVGKQIAENLLARPGFVNRLADALERNLNATRRVWDKQLDKWIEEPDGRIQLQAAFGILANLEGEPIKRIFHAQVNATGDPADALFANPELTATIRRRLDQAERHHRGPGRPRKVEPIDAEPSNVPAPGPAPGPRGMARAQAETAKASV